MKNLDRKHLPYWIAVAFGVAYGVVSQAVIRVDSLHSLYGAMSFGFVFILPFILGFITLWFASTEQRSSWLFRIFAPWATISLSLLFSLVIGWEGAICMIMAGIIYLPLASLGGIISGLVLSRVDRNRLSSSVLASLLSLPFVSAYFESYSNLSTLFDTAETAIIIEAPPEIIWENIIRVRPITKKLDGVFYKLGFPKPIEATLSHEGIGGIRNASFERGLTFIETVDVWEKEKKLSFTIASDPNSTPTTTLDEHVVVGGRYFDVLRGTYEIEVNSPRSCTLKLSSELRISTRFNFYAGVWARFLMLDIQQTILKVIKERAENSNP